MGGRGFRERFNLYCSVVKLLGGQVHLLTNYTNKLLGGTSEGAVKHASARRRGPTGGTPSSRDLSLKNDQNLHLFAYGRFQIHPPRDQGRHSVVRHPRGVHVQDFGAGDCSSLHPLFCVQQIESGTLQYVSEMRTISVIFVSGSGLDVMSPNGPLQAQTLLSNVQSACYAHEGTLNKFFVDGKGLLFLLVFGLPPLVHPDDPTRAVLASAEFVQIFRRLALVGRFGVMTGRSYCGISGSPRGWRTRSWVTW